MSNSIYLSISGQLYCLLSCWLEDADGSFYIALGDTKKKRISYHPTGRIKYHNFPLTNIPITRANFEPLYRTSCSNFFLRITAYDAYKFNPFIGTPREQDSVIEVQVDTNTPVLNFSFVVTPWNMLIPVNHFSVRYNDLFALTVLIENEALSEKPQLPFRYMFPQGPFKQDVIDRDQGLIDFHQRIQKTQKQILYSPNGEGTYKFVFATPMLRSPEFQIWFANPEYRAEAESCTKSVLRFKVKDGHGNTIKNEVAITGIVLDARL